MIKHDVQFRLKRPTDDATRAQFLTTLRAFAVQAPFATEPVEVQESLLLRGESPRTDALMRVTFGSRDDFQPYIDSEAHQALVRDTLEPMCEGWWSVQYEG